MGKLSDLTGRRVGRWIVLALHPRRHRCGHALWLCRCDCGTERVVFGSNLHRGLSASCGCVPKFFDMAGRRFGRWTVLALHPERTRDGAALWLCRCDCGTERIVLGTHLRRGSSSSCGCFRRDVRRKQKTAVHRKRKTQHGMSRTPAYRSWESMKARCLNPNNCSYENYGGRGISVYPDWLDFANFYADMLDRPPGTSIDRIDPDGNYEPGNCRWAPASVQLTNRRPRSKRRQRRPHKRQAEHAEATP
jgi:hypothetical protein